jgi:hypothetical protein
MGIGKRQNEIFHCQMFNEFKVATSFLFKEILDTHTLKACHNGFPGLFIPMLTKYP